MLVNTPVKRSPCGVLLVSVVSKSWFGRACAPAMPPAYSDEFGHLIRFISDSDSDSVRTLFGAERRCGWIVSEKNRSSQGRQRGFKGLLSEPLGEVSVSEVCDRYCAVDWGGRASGGDGSPSRSSRCRRSLRVTDSPLPRQ